MGLSASPGRRLGEGRYLSGFLGLEELPLKKGRYPWALLSCAPRPYLGLLLSQDFKKSPGLEFSTYKSLQKR